MVNLHSASIDRLFEAILNLKTTEDCYKFFEDVCTIKELQDMAQRLDVAFLLTEGQTVHCNLGPGQFHGNVTL